MFIMGEKVKPQYKSDFDVPAEGIHILKVDDAKVEPSKDSVKNFKVDVPGKIYGGRIKHKKTDQGNIMANIAEYYTTKEAQELMKSGSTTGATGKGRGKAKEEKEPEAKEDEEWV